MCNSSIVLLPPNEIARVERPMYVPTSATILGEKYFVRSQIYWLASFDIEPATEGNSSLLAP